MFGIKELLVSCHHQGKQTSSHAFVSAAWQQASIIDEKTGEMCPLVDHLVTMQDNTCGDGERE